MKRVYEFNNGRDMMDLARIIQSKVFWKSRFYDINGGDEPVPYRSFWEYCDYYVSEGYKKVELDEEDDTVEFLR